MTGHRLHAAHLGLAHSQKIFLVTMIDFNLPSIKAGLHQQLDRSSQISRQEVSGVAIISARVQRKLIRHGSDYYESQSPLAAAAPPQHVFHLFIFDHPSLAPEINLGFVPCTFRLLAHLLGSEFLLIIFAARAGWGGETQPR